VGFVITGGLSAQYPVTLAGGSGTGSPTPLLKGRISNADPDTNQTTAGDPVNIANGDANQVETDITLSGIGLPLSFTRRYDSQNNADVGLGVGWAYSFSDNLTFNPDGSIVWTDGQDHEYTFTPDGQGGYLTPTAIFGTFTATASGYHFRDTTGLVIEFDGSGRLTGTTDRNGNALVIAYDADGRLASVTEADAPERSLSFTWTGNHITAISDVTGRTWQYAYTGNELTEVTAPADAQTPEAAEQYAYYNDTGLGGLLQQVTLPNGGTTTFTYYANRRAYQVTDPDGFTDTYSYNLYTNQTTYTDANDHTTTYGYDSHGDLISLQLPDGAAEAFTWQNDLRTSATDVFGRTETFTYDALGNLTKDADRAGNVTTITYDPVYSQLTTLTQPGGRTTTFVYDSHGNAIRITDALGNVTTMTYDPHGLLLTLTTPRGNQPGASGDFTTTYTYNNAGQLLTRSTGLPSTVTYTYDPRGHLLSETDADGHTTTYEYDLLDRLIQVTDPLNGVTTHTYDAIGNLIATTDALGRTTRSVYDPDRRLVAVINADGSIQTTGYAPVGNLVTSTDELGRTTQTFYDTSNRPYATATPDLALSLTRYDGDGRVVATTDPLGNVTRYAYDKLDRLVSTRDALGGSTTSSYDALGNLLSVTDPLNRTTTYTYDLLNRQKSMTDPLNHTSTTTYDADGNVASETDPLNHTTRYSYDVADRLTSDTDPLGGVTSRTYDTAGNVLSITDPSENTTTYTYDPLNRETAGTNALGATRTYGYDAVGNMTSSIDADGRKTVYTYDSRNRQTSEQWLDATGAPIRTFRFTYDASGARTSASDPDSSYTFTDDANGRLTSVDNRGTPGVPDVVLSYDYDTAGNEVSVTDTINGQASGLQSMTYDPLNRMTQITLTGNGIVPARVNLTYNAASELTNLTRYADVVGKALVASSAYTDDAAGRLTQLTDTHGATTLASYQWTLDAAGRVTQETNAEGTTSYTYNAADELTSATHSAQPNESYSYDANGNRTGASVQTGKSNELLSDGTSNYVYDREGNLIQKTAIATGAVTQYTWDYRDRLTQVVPKDGTGAVTEEVDYTYDVYNDRISASVQVGAPGSQAPVVQRFVYDGTNIALQFNGAGALTDRYLYGPAVDQVLADESGSGKISWLLGDDLGTVRDVIDSSGAVLDHIGYDSFGRVVGQTNPSAAPLFGFAGQVLDQATGLQYDQARYYDPSTGRFLSQDPSSFAGGDANLYRYVGNAPTDGIDPTGLSVWNRIGGALRAIGGAAEFLAGVIFAGVTAETGVGFVGGVLVATAGADQFQAGIRQLFSGQTTQTEVYNATLQATNNPNLALGADVFAGSLGGVTSAAGRVGTIANDVQQVENGLNNAQRVENAVNEAQQAENAVNDVQAAENAPYDGCFPADTLVATSDGLRPIESVRSGELVWGYDLATREWTLHPVLETFEQNFLGNLVEVTVAGEVIAATSNHPFWVVEGEALEQRARPEHVLPTPGVSTTPGRWVDAGNLKVGDVLLLRPNRRAVVARLATRQTAQTVYNFRIEYLHTYAVGAAQVLVHNNPCSTNLNTNDATSNFGIYEIKVNSPDVPGGLYKIGKADLNRVTQSSGLPTRLHQQVRKLGDTYGKNNVSGEVVSDLGKVTTQQAKNAETARLQAYYDRTKIIPKGNEKSFTPSQP
jgi:RHS repeat-associated protein